MYKRQFLSRIDEIVVFRPLNEEDYKKIAVLMLNEYVGTLNERGITLRWTCLLYTSEFAMMMTIALRFVPTLLEETEKIMAAQKARGADMESGGLMQRIKALIPVLIPLFVSAFRRAFDLATAMESRCYHGGEGRTKMKVLHLSKVDYITLIVCVLYLAAFITVNILLPAAIVR